MLFHLDLLKNLQVDYKENNLVIFLNTGDSIHGVTKRTATEFSRRFYIFMLQQNIKMHNASINQVSKIEKFLLKTKLKVIHIYKILHKKFKFVCR